MSYLESEYYQTARGLFQKVAKTDRHNLTARFFYLYTSAFSCYFNNRLSVARVFAEEALALPMDGHGEMQRYAGSLRDLIPGLVKEMGGTRQ